MAINSYTKFRSSFCHSVEIDGDLFRGRVVVAVLRNSKMPFEPEPCHGFSFISVRQPRTFRATRDCIHHILQGARLGAGFLLLNPKYLKSFSYYGNYFRTLPCLNPQVDRVNRYDYSPKLFG
jgi:hypothetical protein